MFKDFSALLLSIYGFFGAADVSLKHLSAEQAKYCENANFTGLVGNCMDLLCQGYNVSGVYDIYPLYMPKFRFQAYCDQETDGGGWLVFQRRMNGLTDFYRNWYSYKLGFGEMNAEFWLGNDKISIISGNKTRYDLRIDLETQTNEWRYAVYNSFSLGNESTNYRLSIANYSGNAGDSLSFHNGMSFTTSDHDNDKVKESNCAKKFKGAWWYKDCHTSNLNGRYYGGNGYHTDSFASGVNWVDWGGYYYSFKTTEMKIRPELSPKT